MVGISAHINVEGGQGDFEKVVEQGINSAYETISTRFERNPNPEGNMDFHNRRHSSAVERRTGGILSHIQKIYPGLISDRDILIGRLLGAWHDVVQDWDTNSVPETVKFDDGEDTMIQTKRVRHRGSNEASTAKELIKWMTKANEQVPRPFFSDDDFDLVKQALPVTIPNFSPQDKTIFQPELNESTSIIARALALADLGTAGMDGAEEFKKDGDENFREENLDIVPLLQQDKNLTIHQREYIKIRLTSWSRSQIEFAKGRQTRLDSELAGLPKEVIESLKTGVFNKFDESITNAESVASRRQGLSLDEVAADFGYSICH